MLHTVSGATGLLGSHLVYALLKEGKKVRALHRSSSDKSILDRVFGYYNVHFKDYSELLEWQEADLLDPVDVSSAMEGTDCFYHAAALVSFDPKDREALIRGNQKITANAVNAALEQKVPRFIHVSSVAALGRKPDQKEFDEQSYWVESDLNSNYAKGKYAAEMEVWRGIEEGLSAAIINPCIIIGPGTWGGGSAAIFKNIAEGFKFYSHGINAYVDVRDVVKATLILAAGRKQERYVIAAENRTYKEVFDLIADALKVAKPKIEIKPWMAALAWRWEALKSRLTGSKPLVTRETARTAQEQFYYISDKAKKELGLSFRPLKESIAFTGDCYRKDHPLS